MSSNFCLDGQFFYCETSWLHLIAPSVHLSCQETNMPKHFKSHHPEIAYILIFYLACLMTLFLAFCLAYLRTFHLAFYLAYRLAFCLAYLLTLFLGFCLANPLTFRLVFYLVYLLAFCVAYLRHSVWRSIWRSVCHIF